jgi:hypothetical protein
LFVCWFVCLFVGWLVCFLVGWLVCLVTHSLSTYSSKEGRLSLVWLIAK